jgi:tellurite resistance protein TehA-like permease
MINRNKEISKEQKKQKSIKKEIKRIKKKLPVYFITFILLTVLSIYFLEDPLYDYFGSSYNFILTTVFVFTFVFLVITYRIFTKISNKQKESKAIGTKLYKLMRLEDENLSE